MTFNMKNAILATTVIMALAACGSKKDKTPETGVTVTDSVTGVTVTKDQKAVTDGKGLADAGEQLVGPYTFMLADKVFDSALQVDPNNKKAQFYKTFLKRMMVFKGVLARVRPITRERGNIAQLEKTIRDIPDSPGKTFLIEGAEDIHTASDVQNVVGQYKEALNDFRKFAKANQSIELTLNLNPYMFAREIETEANESCRYLDGQYGDIVVNCDYTKTAQKKINSADMLALAQINSGEMLMWAMYSSYDLTILEKLSDDENFKMQSPEQKLETLKAYPSLGKLRSDETLSLIPALGADISAAAKWALKYQNNLCPRGEETSRSRPHHLFSNGICVKKTSETDRNLAMLDAALQGATQLPIKNDQDQEIGKVTVDIVKFLTNAPKDLRDVLPNRVDADGKVIEYGDDKTFGGLFPNGDIDNLPKN